MYQLQQGPMLGDVAGHSDEKALLQATFLAATATSALLMVAPVLYLQSAETSTFQPMPALDLALQPGQPAAALCIYSRCMNVCVESDAEHE